MPSSITTRVKPPSLRHGDVVGVIAPASNIRRESLDAGCDALRRAGYRPFYSDSILDQDLYFAGSVQRRKRELEEMFTREDVRAVVCARGGYGANYLLSEIDLRVIAAHPKIFVGYSDITSLLNYFAESVGLVTFHGPMVAKDWSHSDGVDMASWCASISSATAWDLDLQSVTGLSGLVDGSADGILYGGCLSILTASLGTKYEFHPDGAILFLEDLAAKPYQIDRMLMQMKLAGKFDGVRGIIFGEMLDCMQNASQGYTLEEVVLRVVGSLGIPVAFGLPSGHVTANNRTLPFGVRAALSVKGGQVSLEILEAAVQP